MTATDRAVIALAVAISPAGHRDVRREQWAADLRDADTLDMSTHALAFGALTTALFHRRTPRRSTWGKTMTALPSPRATEPHTIRTVPVLVAVAVVSLLASGAWLILQPNYGYASPLDLRLGTVGTWLLVFLVPGVACALAALALRTPARGRRLGASMILAAAVWSVLQPFVTPQTDLPVVVVPVTFALAGWLVAVRARPWTWSLLALPIAVTALYWSGALFTLLPPRWNPFVIAVPYLVVVLAGVIATRASAADHRGVGTHGDQMRTATLVDRDV